MVDGNRKMDYAECLGLSEKISADDPKVSLYVDTFRCPVCHAPVFLRTAGGRKIHNEFVHYHSGDTPYCTLRTFLNGKGISANWNLQKSPFNLYITNEGEYYHLLVRFRQVPQRFTGLSEKWITISNMGLSYQISDFIGGAQNKSLSTPPAVDNRTLEYDKDFETMEMMNSWGVYIDYFKDNCAFFDYSTGKKIQVDDMLYCDTEYIFVHAGIDNVLDSQEKRTYFGILVKRLGILHNKNYDSNVTLVKFPLHLDDNLIRFAKVFSHSLSEKSAEPFLMWPPSIKTNECHNLIFDDTHEYIKVNRSSEKKIWAIDESVHELPECECTVKDGIMVVFDQKSMLCTLRIRQGSDTSSITLSKGTAALNLNNYRDESVELLDKTDQIATAPNAAVKIKVDFLLKARIRLKTGKKVDRNPKIDALDISELFGRLQQIDVYNYHNALVRRVIIKNENQQIQSEFPLEQLRGYPRNKTPAWVPAAVRNYSAIDPVNARLAHLSYSKGTISSKLQTFLEGWR